MMMTKQVFLVTLFTDDGNTKELFGIFSDLEKATNALKQFSAEIEFELIEDLHYEISKFYLDKSNYLLNQKHENS